jgi:glycosyltransferase involved in cell wall biosynthesis
MTRKILISGGLSGGGVQTHVQLLCDLLLEAGAEVSVCATHSEWSSGGVFRLKQTGVKVYLPRFGRLEALASWPFRMERQFDVCYCIGHGRIHDLAKTFLRKEGCTVYHEILTCPAPGNLMYRSIVKMDFVIANSRAIAREMEARWPAMRVRVIPFLTSDHRMPEPARRSAVERRILRVVYLGRLASHKRPQQLVKEWLNLVRYPPLAPASLDIYGDDKQPETLSHLCAEISRQNMERLVRCHGAYSHAAVPEILSKADIVVLPSQWEGLPLVLIEAMQHGVPVVATSVGGIEELGENNPDVIITGSEWPDFIAGLQAMAAKLRSGHINHLRLHRWTEERYGFEIVAPRWKQALINSCSFFAES